MSFARYQNICNSSAVQKQLYPMHMGCRTDFADIQNKKECGDNRQWQNHYLKNWVADMKGRVIT